MVDYFEEGIRIDELNPALSASLTHVLAAMKDGLTVNLTAKQVLDLFLLYPEFIAKADDSDVVDLQTSLTNLITATRDNLRRRSRVRAATTGNVTIATALNPGDTIDGVVLASGDWVLVRAQTTGSQNGIYMVDVTPARVPEYMTWSDHVAAQIIVSEGTINAGSLWQCLAVSGGTLGTTAMVWSAPAAASPSKTNPVSADRFWIWDSVSGLMKGLPLGNLGRVANVKVTVFGTSGTWTPDPKMIFADLETQGGGGAGGGAQGGSTSYWCGGGGGGGAYSRRTVTKAQVGASHAVTIGPGGSSSSGNGGSGSQTSIGALCASNGGSGGTVGNSANAPNGGFGGTRSGAVADLSVEGNPGSGGIYGGAWPVAVGEGGTSVLGRAGRNSISTASAGSAVNGTAGDLGGGGSGGSAWNTTGVAGGGNGGNGYAVITEYLSE